MLSMQSDDQRIRAVLADEAVFILAGFVIPGVTVFFPQIDAWLVSTMIVWLTVVPVGAAHGLISERGVI